MHTYRPLLIGLLVLTEVAIWQWRMLLAHRDRRLSAVLLGFVGAALQITAISQVVADVHDVLSIAAYAGGVGCGVLLGLVAGDQLTPSRLEVTIISSVDGIAEALWDGGWSGTAHRAQAGTGPVTSVQLNIARADEAHLRRAVCELDPCARWITKEIRSHTGTPPTATARLPRRRRWERQVHAPVPPKGSPAVVAALTGPA